MTLAKKTVRKQTKKTPETIPWHKQLWVRILGGITAIGAILTVLDTSYSLIEKFYHPKPVEITISDLPIRIKYNQNAGYSVKTPVRYTLQVQTNFFVENIDQDSITISDFKIDNKRIINTDSVTNSSLQLHPGTGYSSRGDEIQILYEVEYNVNAYLTLLPSIMDAKIGKVYNLGYAIFSVPYFTKGLRKVKDQKIPIELEVI